MKVVLFAVLYGLFALSVGSQEVPNAATLNAKAVAAYQAKDYYAFLKLEQQAHELEPKNPQIVYNLACGEALNGHPAEAIQFLDKLLQQKLDLVRPSGKRSRRDWPHFANPSFGVKLLSHCLIPSFWQPEWQAIQRPGIYSSPA
jgi:hypothetical protein